jgi:hypothetical protein
MCLPAPRHLARNPPIDDFVATALFAVPFSRKASVDGLSAKLSQPRNIGVRLLIQPFPPDLKLTSEISKVRNGTAKRSTSKPIGRCGIGLRLGSKPALLELNDVSCHRVYRHFSSDSDSELAPVFSGVAFASAIRGG